MKTVLTYLMLACTTLGFISCSGDEDGEIRLVATSIEIFAGAEQNAIGETELTNSVEIIVKDQNGNPFEGATVSFMVGEGAISSGAAISNTAGIVMVSWELGPTVGIQTLTVTAFEFDGVTHLIGSPLSVKATASAEPPVAASIELVAGDSQTATVETTLENAVDVLVKDQYGNPFEGTTVNFSAIEGSLSPASAATSAAGDARVSWTLGGTLGIQTLTVTAFEADETTHLTGSPLSVTATADPPPPVATSIELATGDNQSAFVETALTNSVEVLIKDQYGDASPGATVNFEVDEGSLSDAAVTTDASGIATVSWTLGATVGMQTLTVTAFEADGITDLAGSPLAVTATANATPVASSVELVAGDNQSAVTESTLTNSIEVLTRDQYGNAFPGTTVNFEVVEGALSSLAEVADAAGMATVSWTLGATIGTQTLTVTAFEADGITALMGSPISVMATASDPILSIGDFHEGGIIFYLDNTGESGLVCAVSDQSSVATWGEFTGLIAGADGTAIGTGAQNTIDMELAFVTVGLAADICANLDLNGYNDWFLPSKDELNEMYVNKDVLDATAIANGGDAFITFLRYWTSTEFNDTGSWAQSFNAGTQDTRIRSTSLNVRPVRAF